MAVKIGRKLRLNPLFDGRNSSFRGLFKKQLKFLALLVGAISVPKFIQQCFLQLQIFEVPRPRPPRPVYRPCHEVKHHLRDI